MDKYVAKYKYRFDAGELAEEKRSVARFGMKITKVETDPDYAGDGVSILTIVAFGAKDCKECHDDRRP